MAEINPKKAAERRRYPRIKREIPLKIKYDNYDTVGQTRDISCIGTYCTVNKHIPLFSKISIILLLPLNNPGKNDYCSVRCKGAVVRVERNPQDDNEYNVAIYFNEISRSGRAKLAQYVHRQLRT